MNGKGLVRVLNKEKMNALTRYVTSELVIPHNRKLSPLHTHKDLNKGSLNT
jgi:hypothetical protein